MESTPNRTCPQLNFVTCAHPEGVHRMAYWEWGDPANLEVVLCVHGLTRTGRDFDHLAKRLSKHFRVVCPDIVGRGQSDWLSDGSAYTGPQYVADILTLIARLNTTRVHWVGTSMGGLIGLGLAGALASGRMQPARPVPDALPAERRLQLGRVILNDIGPSIDASGLARIAEYVDKEVKCATFEDAVHYVRTVSASFGPHTDEQWRELTHHVFVKNNGGWVRHYDRRIAQPLSVHNPVLWQAAEAALWRAYQSIESPILILRGQDSDLLTERTAQNMLRCNMHASLVEFEGVGHAPTLMTDHQIQAVEDFLLARL